MGADHRPKGPPGPGRGHTPASGPGPVGPRAKYHRSYRPKVRQSSLMIRKLRAIVALLTTLCGLQTQQRVCSNRVNIGPVLSTPDPTRRTGNGRRRKQTCKEEAMDTTPPYTPPLEEEPMDTTPPYEPPELMDTTPPYEPPELMDTTPPYEPPELMDTTPPYEPPELMDTTPPYEPPELMDTTPP
nr:protein kintoun-like isoform X2 [Oryctolagus cuniculus]